MVYYAVDGVKGSVTGEFYTPYPDAKHAYISYGWDDVPPGSYSVTLTPVDTPLDLSKYRHFIFGIGYIGPAPEEWGYSDFTVTLAGSVSFNGTLMANLLISNSVSISNDSAFGIGADATTLNTTKLFEFNISNPLNSLQFTINFTSSSSSDYQTVSAFITLLRNKP